jgi:hypothetical protein
MSLKLNLIVKTLHYIYTGDRDSNSVHKTYHLKYNISNH